MTTWINSQFPRPDFHRRVQRHYGLQDTGFPPRRLLSQLEDIREVINLYPKRRKAAKMRQQTVLTRMSKVQKRLVVILGLERKGEGELG